MNLLFLPEYRLRIYWWSRPICNR